MHTLRRILLSAAIFALLAASCGSDGDVTEEQADEALDQIDEDLGIDSTEDEVVEEESVDDVPEDDVPEEEVPEEVPEEEVVSGPMTTDGCLFLIHDQAPEFAPAPYHSAIYASLAEEGSEISVTHPDGSDTTGRFSTGADGTGFGFDVLWAVDGPGPVNLPVIMVDGVDVTPQLSADFFGGITDFVAAGPVPFTHEQIAPSPCGMEIFFPVDAVLG